MSVLIEDSPRANLDSWIVDRSRAGTCAGAVISPFATPWAHQSGPGRKPSARKRIGDLREAGVPVWLDPMTHALQMSAVGDFRYYDQWDLWSPGRRGALDNDAERVDHVKRVLSLQDDLGTRPLAPTLLLHTGLSETSTRALELAREAVRQQPGCAVMVAGSTPFWASGVALDAHLGALAGLEPSAWFLVAVKNLTTWPVEADPAEIDGLCRAARALSTDAPVHISHGDLAALPAVAAGANSVGTGWDRRQRVCSVADYAARAEGGDGGGWLQRVTLRGLLGAISANEADTLRSRDAALLDALGGLPAAPGPRERFDHHVDALAGMVADLDAISDAELRYERLAGRYATGRAQWARVQQLMKISPSADAWIDPLAAGLERYARTEGFATQ